MRWCYAVLVGGRRGDTVEKTRSKEIAQPRYLVGVDREDCALGYTLAADIGLRKLNMSQNERSEG